MKLQDLTSLLLERTFNHLKDAGGVERKTRKPRPLSAKTVHHIAGLVNVALVTAVRWKLLTTNPMAGVVLPKVVKHPGRALEADQLSAFQDLAQKHGLFEFVMAATATGCRRGELLAAQWSDVDFVGRVLRISKSLEQTRGQLKGKVGIAATPGSANRMGRRIAGWRGP